MPTKKASKAKAVPGKTKRSGTRRTNGSEVLVWSEVGVTLPIGDSTAHLRFGFGHERLAKNDTTASLKETTALVDEFNEETLDRLVRKYMRTIRQILNEDDDSDEAAKKRRRRGRK